MKQDEAYGLPLVLLLVQHDVVVVVWFHRFSVSKFFETTWYLILFSFGIENYYFENVQLLF